MALTGYLISKQPNQTQFGLDAFTEQWKYAETADVVLQDSSVPQRLDPHPDYPHMFVTDRYTTETGEKATVLDVVYTGCLKDDGEGGPLLPPPIRSSSNSVQSASSTSNGDRGSPLLTDPITIQYYASVTKYSYISTTNVSESCVAAGLPDAPCDPIIISILFKDESLRNYYGEDLSQLFLCTYFGYNDTDVTDSTEIVSGQYWQNIETKSRFLITKPASTTPIDGCPALGACTGVLGDCVITSEAICADLGGTYHGDGSSCS